MKVTKENIIAICTIDALIDLVFKDNCLCKT